MIIEPKRTPAPWEVFGNTDVINQEEGQICRCETKADAEFIVTACNAHDQLVEALRRTRQLRANPDQMVIIDAALAAAGAA